MNAAVKYTDEEMLDILRQRVEDLGGIPTTSVWTARHFRPSRRQYVHRFGSWRQALKLIGVHLPGKRAYQAYWTDERIEQALARYIDLWGKPDSLGEYFRITRHDESFPSDKVVRAYLERKGFCPVTKKVQQRVYEGIPIVGLPSVKAVPSPIAQEFREERLDLNLRQYEVARSISVSVCRLSRFETGRSTSLDPDIVSKLRAYYAWVREQPQQDTTPCPRW